MAGKLEAFAKQHGVKYFLFNFTDFRGTQRSKLVPASAAGAMEEDGAGFAGFATWLDMTPAHPDMFSVPDTSSLIQLPWKPEVAWVAGDLVMDGAPVDQAPRRVLSRMVDAAAEKGFVVRAGVEAEYHLIDPSGTAISDPRDIDAKPCYDQSALMRRYDVISEICDAMLALGWGTYQNDHEDANGQFEMNWDYADCMVTADRHAFFKFMVKSIAEKHGLRATFMPKPFAHLTGNGCHAHVSAWDPESNTNLFLDEGDELGLSKLAHQFLGGVLHHAEALCALTNPCVNSYKRINAPGHHVGGDVVAERGHVVGQQPHPHGAHPGSGAVRVPARRRRGEPVPAARGHHRGRARRHRQRPQPRQAEPRRHVRRRPQGARPPAPALPAGRHPRVRQGPGAQGCARQFVLRLLRQAQDAGVGRVLQAPDGVGADHDARLLIGGGTPAPALGRIRER